MGENVIGMRGDITPYAGVPRQGVIDVLTELLERAKSGDLQAIAAAWTDRDGSGNFQYTGCLGGYSMIGALAIMNQRLVEIAGEDS